MITIHRERFILLNQYRHARRMDQYSFPREFAEQGLSPIENACRELKEKIKTVITRESKFLGRVISDSGLTSRMVYVYLVEVESYEWNSVIYERIKKIAVNKVTK